MTSETLKIPGFIDLQVNGFKGVDFSSSELTVDDCIRVCDELQACGTAGFLPTMITAEPEIYQRNLAVLADAIESKSSAARLLGIHVEGPFISSESGAVGAHEARLVTKPDVKAFAQMQEWARGHIRLITLAAELEGAVELAEYCDSQGVTVALGHQMAGNADLARLADAGATMLTHLGNSVPNLLPRHENPLWAGLAADELAATIITDGHHLPPAVIKSFLRVKGVERIAVISDSSPLAGLAPGNYKYLNEDVVLEPSGKLHMPDRHCLAASSATMMQCMNFLASLDLLSLDELVKVGLTNPCKLIGADPSEIPSARPVIFNTDKNQFEIPT